MKKYNAPLCEVVVVNVDILMASNENELSIDRFSAIFDL